MVTKKKFLLLLILSISVIIILTLLAENYEFIGPFNKVRIAYSYILDDTSHLQTLSINDIEVGSPKRTPAYEIWIHLLRQILGLNPEEILKVPLGIFIFPFSFLYLFDFFNLKRSVSFISIIIIFAGFRFASLGEGIGAFVFLIPLYLILIRVFLELIKKRKPSYVIIALICFSALQYLHPVGPLWSLSIPLIIFLTSAFLSFFTFESFFSKKSHFLSIGRLGIIFVIVFFSLSVFPYMFIERMSTGPSASILIKTSIERLSPIFWGSGGGMGGEEFMYARGSRVLDILKISHHALTTLVILVSLIVFLILGLKKMKRNPNNISTKQEEYILFQFLSIVFITGVVTAFFYVFATGYLGTKYLVFVFPFAAIIAISKLRHRIKYGVIILIIFFIVLGGLRIGTFYLKFKENPNQELRKSVQGPFNFIIQNSKETRHFLVDFYTGGYMSIELAKDERKVDRIIRLNSEIYQYIRFGGEPPPVLLRHEVDYVFSKHALNYSFVTAKHRFKPGLRPILVRRTNNVLYWGNVVLVRPREI
ncbi:hypothetical protein AKJ47_01340 [candidate division MSBL1 archaeon SCGC-AAA261G05]|uniref:Uncharacterized protein n=1 Tax=candidate division MSBL1 archaeon SCGC-AAA261G05 TaxID=1698276 RepID=A0A133VBW0_9EURY|nr:hypothetical protein AKJ47_01340 [candidate division MSBL1 archaeon SCGC-AAA261G05]